MSRAAAEEIAPAIWRARGNPGHCIECALRGEPYDRIMAGYQPPNGPFW